MPTDYPGHTLNFLGLRPEETAYDKARFAILPAPYEQTTTYRKGTHGGPGAILSASQEVELYDEETDTEPYLAGIHTLGDLDITASGPEDMVKKIYQAGKTLINDEKLVCMLGGEHTISTGMVKACKDKYDNLSVLQLDAHADLRNSYQESKYSHACVMRRIREIVKTTVGVGIRNISTSEHKLIEREKIPIIHAARMFSELDWVKKALDDLGDNVYLTIDCDFFDPSIMPAVGTPEPGGGLWYQTLAFLRELIRGKNIVAFDVVELCPLADNNISEFTAAKLIYKTIGYLNLKEKS
jgi:agmatinase